MREAQKDRLNQGLRVLSSWCLSRAMGEHDTGTTLSMLEGKVADLRGNVIQAGWKAVNEQVAKRGEPGV